MWEGQPGNTTVKTDSFIVTKNRHIHQTAHPFPVTNAWQHHFHSLDTAECQHPALQCSWEHTKSSVNMNLVCVNTGCFLLRADSGPSAAEVSPGGVHASTDDWTSTDRLLEGMGIFLSLYFAKAAWTASVCKSREEKNMQFSYRMKQEHQACETFYQYVHMITRSEAFIPSVGHPRLVVFGTWKNSLGGGLDPVVNLQRWIYTCRETRQQGKGQIRTEQKHKLYLPRNMNMRNMSRCIICYGQRAMLLNIAWPDQVSTRLMVIPI